MDDDKQRRDSMQWGVWLIGLGLLFASRSFWPGIMFVIAASAFMDAHLKGRSWQGIQSAWGPAFIGLWAFSRFNIAFLFVGLGVGSIVYALVKPAETAKPKPFVDASLE